MKSSTRKPGVRRMKSSAVAADLRLARAVTARRRCWAGLNTSAEFLLGGLDGAPEVLAMASGRWSLVKLLGLALARVGRPAAVDCWTWTLSRRAIARLRVWQAEGVAVRVAVDASLWRRQPRYAAELLAGLGDSVRAASSHAKTARVSGPNGSVFIMGSGNLNLCRRAEVLLLSTDPALASWLAGLTSTLFAAIPAGAPHGADDDRAAALEHAFPPADARPSWADGLPVLDMTGVPEFKFGG